MKIAAWLLVAGTALAAESKLADAAMRHDPQAVTALLAQKADPNLAQADGTTALMWAVRQDDAALIDRLLRAGASPKLSNRYGITALYLACVNGNAAVIERLIKAGADVNAPAVEGETPLMTIARTGNVEAAKILLANKADIHAREPWRGQTALIWAIGQSHPEMVKLLVDHGAEVNLRTAQQKWLRQTTAEPREKWLPQGYLQPLYFAARQGCTECAKILLDKGAEIDAQDLEGVSPILSAVINGHYDTAALFIDRGANVNLPDKTGRTPLYSAVDFHTMPVSNRPSPKEIDNQLTSLDLIHKLVEKGADVNARLTAQQPYRTKLDRGDDTMFNAGTTALIRAAKAGDYVVVKYLLEHGAIPTLTTRAGINPLMAAANVGTREEDTTGRHKTEEEVNETIRLLLDAKVDVNAVDMNGRTALIGAANWGLDKVVRFLVANGANLDVKDKRGFTALDAAMGRAGGVGFDQSAGEPHPSTVAVLQELTKK